MYKVHKCHNFNWQVSSVVPVTGTQKLFWNYCIQISNFKQHGNRAIFFCNLSWSCVCGGITIRNGRHLYEKAIISIHINCRIPHTEPKTKTNDQKHVMCWPVDQQESVPADMTQLQWGGHLNWKLWFTSHEKVCVTQAYLTNCRNLPQRLYMMCWSVY